MLNNPYFDNGLYRKYIVLFGSLFNQIYIERTDENKQRVDDIKVPLMYAPKDKVLSRLIADPNIDKKAAIVLPAMSFEFTNMYSDPERNLNAVGQTNHKNPDNSNVLRTVYNSVAYNMSFSLYIYCKYEEDASKILGQILPYFKPDFSPKVELIPDLCIVQTIPIILNNVTKISDKYEGDYKERRELIWELDFTLKGSFYGPVVDKPIIKFITVTGNIDSPVEQLNIQPGLDANGNPTSIRANSVPANTIFIDDNWTSIDTCIEL